MEIDKASLTTSPWIYPGTIQGDALSREDCVFLREIGVVRHYAKRSVIQAVGSGNASLYFIERGAVRNSMFSAEGIEKVCYYLNAGCFAGVAPYFHHQPIQYTDVAVEDVQAIEISTAYADKIIARPTIAGILLRTLSYTARILASQIVDLTFRDTVEKVCRLLYCRLGEMETTGKKSVKVNQTELANIAGAHRVSISVAIAQLKKEGLIEILPDGAILVNDWDALGKKGFEY